MFRRSRPVSLALVGLFPWLAACSSWQQIGIGELPEHDWVRVTSVSVGSSELDNPRVEADSIKGTVGELDYAIPVAGVRTVEARKFDLGATAATGFIVISVVAVTAYATACMVTDTSDDWIDLCPARTAAGGTDA